VGTLLDSGREVLVKTDTLAKKISPFSITLGEIDYSEEYFKALFIDVQRTPELMNANAVAREVFQEKRLDDEYKPHMSLLYANMPAHEKEVLIREVFREVGGRKAFSGAQFVVDRLDLYSTDGTVDNWYFVDSCYLEKAQNRLQA
jgi:2'-5' RNA ligase